MGLLINVPIESVYDGNVHVYKLIHTFGPPLHQGIDAQVNTDEINGQVNRHPRFLSLDRLRDNFTPDI